jgi:hypothetical protein
VSNDIPEMDTSLYEASSTTIERRASESTDLCFNLSVAHYNSEAEQKIKVLFLGTTGDERHDTKLASIVFSKISELSKGLNSVKPEFRRS